jgi:hypothetical protein
MPSLPSVSDIKTYLGLTTTGDDALIAERLTTGIGMAERDTGRTFASGSNTSTTYSTNNETLIGIHDRPITDASRVVTWNGAALAENTDCWFLPDRRDPNVTTQLQIRPFDTSRADWYKADPYWFDKGLDRRYYGNGLPNDLVDHRGHRPAVPEGRRHRGDRRPRGLALLAGEVGRVGDRHQRDRRPGRPDRHAARVPGVRPRLADPHRGRVRWLGSRGWTS